MPVRSRISSSHPLWPITSHGWPGSLLRHPHWLPLPGFVFPANQSHPTSLLVIAVLTSCTKTSVQFPAVHWSRPNPVAWHPRHSRQRPPTSLHLSWPHLAPAPHPWPDCSFKHPSPPLPALNSQTGSGDSSPFPASTRRQLPMWRLQQASCIIIIITV